MKYDYSITWHNSTEGSPSNSPYVSGSGWYVKVGNFEPWGPFDNPGEAADSIKIEWERFENPPKEWADSDKFKVTQSEDDPNLFSIDFTDDVATQLEESFGAPVGSPEFQVAFDKFVNDAIQSQLDKANI